MDDPADQLGPLAEPRTHLRCHADVTYIIDIDPPGVVGFIAGKVLRGRVLPRALKGDDFRRETPTSVLYSFGPYDSIPFHTRIDEALQPYLGGAASFIGNLALAFHNTSAGRRWYVAISDGTQAVYVLRSRTDGQVQSVEWDVIGVANSTVTGLASNLAPGFAKNGASGSLYVEDGWAFMFLGVGPTNLWNLKMGQIRFRP